MKCSRCMPGASVSNINNREYYVARAIAARTLAEAAQDPKIEAIHRFMAVQYDELIDRSDNEKPPRFTLVSG